MTQPELPLATPGVWRRCTSLARRAAASGAPPLIISIIAVQGFASLAQLVVARVVSPSDFGIVRVVEVMITTLLLLASAGMPSLAIRDLALASDEERPVVLGQLVTLAGLTSLVVALFAIAFARVLVPPLAQPYLRALVFAVCLTASSRTAMNYFQAVRRISTLARLSATSSIVAFLALVVLVHLLGMRGWVIGRYVGELSLLLFTLVVLGDRIAFRGVFADVAALWRTWKRGMVISVAFIVRTLHESWHELLAPDGRILFTNIGRGNPFRVWLEYLADWRLIERSEADLIALCRAAEIPVEPVLVRDATGLSIVAMLRKG